MKCTSCGKHPAKVCVDGSGSMGHNPYHRHVCGVCAGRRWGTFVVAQRSRPLAQCPGAAELSDYYHGDREHASRYELGEKSRPLERADAIRLAREKFGNGVHVVDGGRKAPSGWRYKIRIPILQGLDPRRRSRAVGEGRTWYAACKDAGIEIPEHLTEHLHG